MKNTALQLRKLTGSDRRSVLQFSTRASKAFARLCLALERATQSRQRLTQLAPDIFSESGIANKYVQDEAQRRKVQDHLLRLKIYAEHDPQATSELAEFTSAMSRTVEPELKGTPLDRWAYIRLPEAQRAALKAEYVAYRKWQELIDLAQREFDAVSPPPPLEDLAHVAHLCSLYHQAEAGIYRSSDTQGLFVDECPVPEADDLEHHERRVEELKLVYGNNTGSTTLEDIYRRMILGPGASTAKKLQDTGPSPSTNEPPAAAA